MRIAVVHDWFTSYAGSERVVEQILCIYPHSDVFTIFADPLCTIKMPFLKGRKLQTSFIGRLPFASRMFRHYLPFMPLAIEQFDLSEYDIIISSSHAVSKGVLTGPDQLHISYVHSPIRYAWDLQHQYLSESSLGTGLVGLLVRWFLHKLRIWDYRTAAGVDFFISNSRFISRRINKVYRRSSVVIYPPVDVEKFELCESKDDFYLTASRLVPYKRIDLIISAFAQMPDKRLIVIGTGPDEAKLRKLLTSNITFMGYQPFNQLMNAMQRAKAFVFAAEEDFGIIPVEAQACGTPVIAYGKGGAIETVIDSNSGDEATGVFFYEQTCESIIDAVKRFESLPFKISPHVCRRNAERFSVGSFKSKFRSFVEDKWHNFITSSSEVDYGS